MPPHRLSNHVRNQRADCAESMTMTRIALRVNADSGAAAKRPQGWLFLNSEQLMTSKMPWLMAGLVCLSLLWACARQDSSVPPIADNVAVGGPEEITRELVPGLDIWSQERRPAPVSGVLVSKEADVGRVKRHQEFMQAGVPVEYRGRTSPYPATTNIIIEGSRLYKERCATCHGSTGLGDGVASRGLTPPPALLAYLIDQPRSVDEYLLWSIAEGGAQFGTEMPAYKAVLTEPEIWQIIIYMRAGFPNIGEAG